MMVKDLKKILKNYPDNTKVIYSVVSGLLHYNVVHITNEKYLVLGATIPVSKKQDREIHCGYQRKEGE